MNARPLGGPSVVYKGLDDSQRDSEEINRWVKCEANNNGITSLVALLRPSSVGWQDEMSSKPHWLHYVCHLITRKCHRGRPIYRIGARLI